MRKFDAILVDLQEPLHTHILVLDVLTNQGIRATEVLSVDGGAHFRGIKLGDPCPLVLRIIWVLCCELTVLLGTDEAATCIGLIFLGVAILFVPEHLLLESQEISRSRH